MNKIHQQRIFSIVIIAIGVSIAAGLILFALKKNINVFFTPSELSKQTLPSDYHFRLGGLVKKDSVKRQPNSLNVDFIITDHKQDTSVHYNGVLPDLFKEDKGVIVEGTLNPQGIVIADKVLAKHDENYMPKKVYDELRKNQS